MKKRLFPLLLALMLLITLCTPFAQAAGRVLTVTSVSGRAGETVSVQVRLTGSVNSLRLGRDRTAPMERRGRRNVRLQS